MKKKTESNGLPKPKLGTGMPVVNQFAAGIDVGDTEHHVAFSDGHGGYEHRVFGSFTSDLSALVNLLKSRGITSVAMEATGVYYVALYLMIEESGIEPVLVNARHCKNVTGRKADDTDAIWICKLHSCGLLRRSFQPEAEFRVLREYVRHRKTLISVNSDSVRRMQKSLELMNVKVHTVISDILGKSGMSIIQAILRGEHNPEVLAEFCDRRIKASEEDIRKSLDGIWKDEHLFTLRQAYEDYQFRLKQIKECEEMIVSQLMKQIAIINEGDVTGLFPLEPVEKKRGGMIKKNQFDVSLEPLLARLAGVNLCKIPGMGEVSVLEFLAETGTDMGKWEKPSQYAAWLNMAPNTKKTGGKIVSTRMMKKKNAAGQTLKMAAQSLWRVKTSLGNYYRKMKGRSGGKAAVLATAHKLSRIIYVMLKEKTEYNPEIANEDQQKHKAKRIKQLERQLEQLKRTA